MERATHILVLQKGQVLEFGTRQTLSGNPNSNFSELRRVGLGVVLV